jgi:hypothetical protein
MQTIRAVAEREAAPSAIISSGHSVHRQVRRSGTLTRYVEAAMRHATYEQSATGQPYHGQITGLPSLRAEATTPDVCRTELRDVLETWLRVRLCQQLPVPPMDGIPLAAWVWIKQGF